MLTSFWISDIDMALNQISVRYEQAVSENYQCNECYHTTGEELQTMRYVSAL